MSISLGARNLKVDDLLVMILVAGRGAWALGIEPRGALPLSHIYPQSFHFLLLKVLLSC